MAQLGKLWAAAAAHMTANRQQSVPGFREHEYYRAAAFGDSKTFRHPVIH